MVRICFDEMRSSNVLSVNSSYGNPIEHTLERFVASHICHHYVQLEEAIPQEMFDSKVFLAVRRDNINYFCIYSYSQIFQFLINIQIDQKFKFITYVCYFQENI